MSPQGVWQEWEGEISRVLSTVGVWQRRALALFSLGVASAQHCGLARAAAVAPGLALVPSTTRRFERLLASERLDVQAARGAVVAEVLGAGRGQTLWLALDETHQGRTDTGARFGMLALRLVYRERAIPLAWVCYRPGEAPASFPVLLGRLIDEVAALLPPAARVVLMTDRGLSWPALFDRCRRYGWSFLCRVQRQTRVQTADGHDGTIGDLAPRPGTRWQGHGRAFLKAGWRDLSIVAVWRRGDEQPWLLVTDLRPAWVRCTQYRHRMDEEESFRDDKSSGFDWDASRVREPAHMDRLLLVLQLAALFVLVQGVFVLRHGLRRVLERPDRRTLSLFSLGLRWLDRARSHLVPLDPSLSLPFP
jgi:hypothetical protein